MKMKIKNLVLLATLSSLSVGQAYAELSKQERDGLTKELTITSAGSKTTVKRTVVKLNRQVKDNTNTIDAMNKKFLNRFEKMGRKYDARTEKLDLFITKSNMRNSARFDSLTQQLDYLDKKINENSKKIKRSAAQSAALTGLFQPYNVGKFSTSVAVGGFSDQQAVAVGAGYRFNGNIAAKAGLAFSEKAPSWNMGINFEF